MKKFIFIFAAAMLTAVCLSACASSKDGDFAKPLQIVTTIFPEYDWAKIILGEKADQAELTMLLDNGVDLHSFQPTTADIVKISACDLFIYVGGESDEWVEDALKEATNKDMQVINLLEVLGDKVKTEEVVEGMEHDHEEEEGEEADEHVWLSLRNTAIFCDAIADALIKLDSSNADIYRANATAYKEQLAAMDEEYRSVAENAKVKTLLFGDRFPFRYLVDDYGLSYYAAFTGCSAETEASFETIVFLSSKMDELGLSAVMTIEGTDHKIAETIRNNTKAKNQQILSLDSMQATTSKDVAAGVTYLSVMNGNLNVLGEALK